MRAIIEFLLDIRNGWHAARRQRAMINSLRAEERRLDGLKAKVVRVGGIQELGQGVILLTGEWEFDGRTPNGPIPIQRLGLDGQMRFCGYTNAELREIHAHRADWVS